MSQTVDALPSSRISVLCVDDDPLVLDGLKFQLRRHCRVLTAPGGAEGLETLRVEPGVGVIVSDMRMPDMDGAEFLARAMPQAPDAASILLTGQCDLSAATRAINQGRISWFLMKPSEPCLVIEAVSTAASQHRLRAVQRLLASRNTDGLTPASNPASVIDDLFARLCTIFGTRYAALSAFDERGDVHIVRTAGMATALFVSQGLAQSFPLEIHMEPTAPPCLLQPSGEASRVTGLPEEHPDTTQLIGIGFAHPGGGRGWIYFAEGANSLRFGPADVQALSLIAPTLARACASTHPHHDTLTGLYDREGFLKQAAGRMSAARAAGERVCAIVLDIRHFRYLNETLGHETGDRILCAVARLLESRAGSNGLVARIGADRFAALIHQGEMTTDDASVVTTAICHVLDEPLAVGTQTYRVTPTVGLSGFDADGEDAQALLRHAEVAMKGARSAGETIRRYSRELGAAAARKMELIQHLREAVDTGQFTLHYQPKVDLRTLRISGCEALLRWRSPVLGNVSPAQFVPLLEETGLITEVGHWVIRQAMAERLDWTSAGLDPPTVAVNVSPIQLRDPDFIKRVDDLLAEHRGLPGISLEITESSLASNSDAMIQTISRLRQLGLSIAIDDFGTGYSSLAYLTRLPLDTIKIDRSFVIRMTQNADSLSVVSAIISLARTLGFKVVAEGVDDPEQLKFLQLLRCDEMQGYLFSPGVPAAEFADMLRERRTLTPALAPVPHALAA